MSEVTPVRDPTFMLGGGEMGERIRRFDWAKSPLGLPAQWPGSLRTLIQVMLSSTQPMFIAWGPERTMLYNDAYTPMLAQRHPEALGSRFTEVWADIIFDIGPIINAAFAGISTHMDDIQLSMVRDDRVVETHFSFGYTPVLDAKDRAVGMFCTAVEITEEVRQSRMRGAELDRLREMLAQAPSFMAMLNGPDHVFEITNDAYLQLIGHRDVLGIPAREALPEVEGQGFFELLDSVFTTGQPYVGRGLPIMLQRRPGGKPEQRFLDFIYQPIRSADGSITGIFAQGHDITDQKLAELAAAASEAKFRRLAQLLPNHVWTAQPDGNLDWFNDQVYAYSGAHAGELDGNQWVHIVHPEDVPSAAESWERSLSTGAPYSTEFRLRQHDGTYRWHLARANPAVAADRHVEYWVGTNTDIEDQKEAALALRESELRVKLALAAAQMGVWECDFIDGRFANLRGDDHAIHLFGGTIDQHESFDDFAARVHPEDRSRMAPAALAALDPSGDGILDIEYRVMLDDGSTARWVHARAQVLDEIFGQRLVGTVRDITQRRDNEARQNVLGRELEHRIKNTLAMVSAIASQTLKGDDIAERRKTFDARLNALAHAHDLLTAKTWQSAPIQSVIESALTPHMSAPDRFIIEGEHISLSAKQSLSMALTIHELATNAAKYGALSTSEGLVRISWTLDGLNETAERQFVFKWQESGGPNVVEPERKGFGSRLITRVLLPTSMEMSGSNIVLKALCAS
ncbi:PAS domain-containing sensor histidine kinase [Devosia sediminis]|uniref:Blue-light-activated histidine kinase n=1 Tax=Devosia sediminis TaxID=2798801 RepID=A0A934MK27_9HYPH|nr:PAS domain-containing protein [Devosia sediminis]MBJ3783091.1 PAS domain-containing protein [Devosia sediminis]